MREILFRGKRTDNGEWVQGCFVSYSDYDDDKVNLIFSSNGNPNTVIPETVGQYTGLTENGKKIFEGDICKHRSNYSGDFVISIVTYTDGQFLSMADNNSGFNLSDKLEVIGNVHDNPELLKGEGR